MHVDRIIRFITQGIEKNVVSTLECCEAIQCRIDITVLTKRFYAGILYKQRFKRVGITENDLVTLTEDEIPQASTACS